VIVQALSAVYGAAATWRRRWYARGSGRARRLARPVISIGNLRVGGTGKTPLTAHVARLLLDLGEQPVILSRGYARQQPGPGVTIVSDRAQVLADLARAGDEPLLLARMLPGVPVLVCADRHAAGQLGEERFGATVHLLDDGFQHVRLERDLDLLLVDEHDLDDRVLPAGRLREPLANATLADALVVPGVDAVAAQAVAGRLGVAEAFAMSRSLGPFRPLWPAPGIDLPGPRGPWFAVAAIERPERFFDDLQAAGWTLSGTLTFSDHHPFTASDFARIAAAAREGGAAGVVTTEKDAVRLEHLGPGPLPVAAAPLRVQVEPADRFAAWLRARLAEVRTAGRVVS
jgi:tetraacyldisaccharide 4'-kinase